MARDEIDCLPRKRWWLKPMCFLLGVELIGMGSYFAYRKWEPDRLAGQARTFFENGDYDNGFLSLRRALQIDPTNEAAARAMAEVTSRMNSPLSLDWRRKVAELNPGSASELFEWAGTAVRLGQTADAEAALAAVPEKERNTARYHAMKGTHALNTRNMAEAEKAFQEALRLEPDNAASQYNLATLHLQSGDAPRRDSARQTLEGLAKGGPVQSLARRALITFMTEQKQLAAALDYSRALLADGRGTFSDRVVHLDLLSRIQSGEVATELAAVQQRAVDRPEDVALLLYWMRTHARSAEALQWAESFRPKLAANAAVAAGVAEILLGNRDWAALQKRTAVGNWEGLEYLRLALLSRAEREQQNATASRAHWKSATAAASRQRNSIVRLAGLAEQWGWKDEWRETLWSAALAPSPEWALQALEKSYRAEGDTGGLLRVARRRAEVAPADSANQNNVAMLCLLRGEQVQSAMRTAQALYLAAPAHPAMASTYAFALHVNGRTSEGLRIFEKIDPTYLEHPALAAHYGILLAANGEAEAARSFLARAKDADLLPEERALMAAAIQKIDGK